MTSKFDVSRPIEGFDDTGVAYGVNVDDGFINVEQTSQSFGKDAMSAMGPEDARWMARQLLEAATIAESHDRWKDPDARCQHSIVAPPGKCFRGFKGCITHPTRRQARRQERTS